MRVVVLGGSGFQGRAALKDLSGSTAVEAVICADLEPNGLGNMNSFQGANRILPVEVDASSKDALVSLFRRDADVVIDLLPLPLMNNAIDAAVTAGVDLVSTNYFRDSGNLSQRAQAAGVAIMPECGLDPGIDLIISGHVIKEFDEIHVFNSYCGGFPEKRACDNPLNYKVSWNWDMVLGSQKRESVFIKDGGRLTVSAADQHDNGMIHNIHFPDLGELEAVPNGDAVFYTDLLGVNEKLQEAGRYSLRWPGWCAFWAPLKKLGFLSEDPVDSLECQVNPRQFLVKHLGPQLQYRDDEKDVVAMRNVFEGIQAGRKKSVVTDLLIERDLETGLFAMNLGVGYPASIVAQMIGSGEIPKKGVLSPATDVPYEPFMAALASRGMAVDSKAECSG